MRKLKLFLLVLPILQTNLAAQSWEFVGLDSLLIKQIYVSGDTIWAGTISRIDTNKISGVYRSSDRGQSWVRIDIALGKRPVICLYVDLNSETIWLVKQLNNNSTGGTLFNSTNRGKDWQLINQLESRPINWIGISPFNKDEIYAVNNGYMDLLYRSTDGGENWQQIGSFPSSSHGNRVIVTLDQVNKSTLYAAVDDRIGGEYFYVSTNKGDTWSYIITPPTVPTEIYTDFFLPERIYLFPIEYISNNSGYEWQTADSGLSSNSGYLSFYQDRNTTQLLYCLRNDGIFYSDNEVIFWKLIPGSETLPLYLGGGGFNEDRNMKNIFIEPERKELFIGTAEGIYKTDLITNVENDEKGINNFSLWQNYPNPFNPLTVISYYIPEKSFVTVIVYDILGNEIETLITGDRSQGEYKTEFNGSGLASGVYFYVLTATTENGKSFKQARKMLMIK